MIPKLLVVDDCPGFAGLLAHHLGGQGYRVITAHSGLEALNQARASLPDLILLDVVMPGLDGLTVCQLLRVQPSTRDIPVIVYASQGGEGLRADCVRAGATEFLFKPFSLATLSERVRQALPNAGSDGPTAWSEVPAAAGPARTEPPPVRRTNRAGARAKSPARLATRVTRAPSPAHHGQPASAIGQ